MTTFAERLKQIREKRRWSQSGLAKACWLEPSAISHFETGRRAPSYQNLLKIADTLNTSLDVLTGRISDCAPAIGPLVNELTLNFAKLSADDQNAVATMVAMLVNKPTGKRGTRP